MKQILLTITICLLLLPLSAQEVTFSGAKALEVRQKTTCGTLDEGKTRYGVWEGRAYSRVQGEKDRHLFNVIGINVRQCDCVEDEVRGKGFRSVSREVMVYTDPETNEIIDMWENPFTGQKVEVVHVANDPVNMRAYAYEKNAEGKMSGESHMRKYGDVMVSSHEIPLFYANPLAGEYQAYVGGAYHAMEIFNTYYIAEEIEKSEIRSLSQSNISWSRLSQWLPWMGMGSKAGIMVFNATGFSTFEWERVPENIKKILDERYPSYKTAPPKDDKRPNETSWTVFKKHMEGKKKEGVGQGRH